MADRSALPTGPADDDGRLVLPAAARNRDPILDVLRAVLPASGLVLEIASGSGEHAVHFARALPGLIWQPSDPVKEARTSIAAWTAAEHLPNIRPPLALDVMDWPWPQTQADAMVCINMIHISPWAATEALMRGAGALLPMGGVLVLYGPYLRDGVETSQGNLDFDADLKRRNPDWGVRRLEDVSACAATHGLALDRVLEMPANNLSVVFRRG
ncbi:hypothetical protein GCM10007301_35160 [Azorhizobium oxalatiphilum]|uniref:SAM-dependent methyltransferase n=1 Tax=Azorhizobium oxalatiphilum TaxID=980631 RepID=A0A917FD82_9HYPH|nr:DUF938 domain-containing protein [Azorhizobium oxalatiphilum]GGF72330.1 hypothetical protein GCM10007301_35160 [Azorhizobium oxalatiphilum]